MSNMSIAIKRRGLLRSVHCLVCNQQEAGILFSENYDHCSPEELRDIVAERIQGPRSGAW